MTTAAATAAAVRRPRAVRILVLLLYATAATTVVVEVINYRYAPEQGFALAVRTGWALLRALGFLILVWHVRRGRAGARPLGLILAITTIFAVGRLVVPRTGMPPLPGIVGFTVLAVLCGAVMWQLYRSPAMAAWLVRHPKRLVLTGSGVGFREAPPPGPVATGWQLTARVAAFTYSPLLLVPALVAVGEVVGGRVEALPAVAVWLAAGTGVSWAVLPASFFLLRGRQWARTLLVSVSVSVLALHLTLCWWLLGVDGLIRDGTPLATAVALVLYGVWRSRRAG